MISSSTRGHESQFGVFGHSGQLPAIQLVADPSDEPMVRRLRVDLRRRGFVVRSGHPGVLQTSDPHRFGESHMSVVMVPAPSAGSKRGQRTLAQIDQLSRLGYPPLVIAHTDDERVGSLAHQPEALVQYGEGSEYDNLFEDLMLALLGPLPSWLDVRVSPSLLTAPTGVSWWSDDLIVADEHFGHVVLISARDAHPILVGLREPHHVHLDRHKLLIADKGSHRVMLGDLEGGALSNIRSISGDRKGLACPNGVHQAVGLVAVADTDHHRVLISDDLWLPSRRQPRWKLADATGGMRYPCGIYIGERYVWVADTFHHRVLAFDHEGQQQREFPGYGWEAGRFAYPTSIAGWHDYLLVADSEARRIQVFQIDEDGPQLVPLSGKGIGDGELGRPWVANPFGLSVNYNGRLAVGDRLRRCVWLIDLVQLNEGWEAR